MALEYDLKDPKAGKPRQCLPRLNPISSLVSMRSLILCTFSKGTHNNTPRMWTKFRPSHSVIPHSPIKSLEFNFQPIRRRYSDVFCCCTQKSC